MANISQTIIYRIHYTSSLLIRKFHSNPTLYLDQKWREKNKLPENPNSFGPLANYPDYSFKDGRPTPLGIGQKQRVDKQREILVKVKKLVGEIDNAVLRHKQLQEEKINEKKLLSENRLKEKKTKLFKPSEPAKKLEP